MLLYTIAISVLTAFVVEAVVASSPPTGSWMTAEHWMTVGRTVGRMRTD